MEERFRFTGENPPPYLWSRYPNWQNAYEEEDLPDQDETTLRPADNQESIDDDVTFTAGDALFADGTTAASLLSVVGGEVESISVYPDVGQTSCWVVRFDVPTGEWVAMNDEWFLQGEGVLPVPVDREGVFPMRFTTRLPLQASGQPIDVTVEQARAP